MPLNVKNMNFNGLLLDLIHDGTIFELCSPFRLLEIKLVLLLFWFYMELESRNLFFFSLICYHIIFTHCVFILVHGVFSYNICFENTFFWFIVCPWN